MHLLHKIKRCLLREQTWTINMINCLFSATDGVLERPLWAITWKSWMSSYAGTRTTPPWSCGQWPTSQLLRCPLLDNTSSGFCGKRPETHRALSDYSAFLQLNFFSKQSLVSALLLLWKSHELLLTAAPRLTFAKAAAPATSATFMVNKDTSLHSFPSYVTRLKEAYWCKTY